MREQNTWTWPPDSELIRRIYTLRGLPRDSLIQLHKISQPVEEDDRSYRGINLFDPEDEELFQSLGSGEFNIRGFQNEDLRRRVEGKNTGQVSRLMKRLRTHGLIKKMARTYKYYLTGLGKQVIALGLKLKNLYLIPELSAVAAR